MSGPQRLVPLAALAIMVLALVYALIPFDFAGAVDCQAPLFGADPKSPPTTIGFVRAEEDCHNKGKTRLATVAWIVLLAGAAGAAATRISPESQQCRVGNHDECRGWWPSVFGRTGEGYACKCSCHAGQPAI